MRVAPERGLPENQGQAPFLQRAVDHEGDDVVEAVVTARRDKAAALKLRKRVREIRQPENHRHRPSSATFRGNG